MGKEWVKKCDRVISLASYGAPKNLYKFVVQVPGSKKHVYHINRKNGNNLWKEAIRKEL